MMNITGYNEQRLTQEELHKGLLSFKKRNNIAKSLCVISGS